VVAFQSNGLPEKLVNFFSSKVPSLAAPLNHWLLIFSSKWFTAQPCIPGARV
jgi:hypothetical protein